ncbi:MFS transporter, partial [Streptomyces sp. ZG43]
AFRRAMPMCAGLLVVGAALAWWQVRRPADDPALKRSEPRTSCAVGAPGLEPEPDR